jgi:hypothetical protein
MAGSKPAEATVSSNSKRDVPTKHTINQQEVEMARIEVEESALDSISAMGKRLQEERDELLGTLKAVNESAVFVQELRQYVVAPDVIDVVATLVDRCNSSPKVME